MEVVLTIIYWIAFLSFITAFFNLKLALAIYIASLILVPYWSVQFGGIALSYNIMPVFYLFVFLYKYKFRQGLKLDYTVVTPFIYLFFSLFLLTPLQMDTPWTLQISGIATDCLKVLPLCFIIWNIGKVDGSLLKYIRFALTFALIVAGLYGLLLTQLEGFNPYTSFISQYFDLKDSAKSYSFLESRVGFSTAGKIQSTTIHPMLWSLHLSLSFVLFAFFYQERGKFNLYLFVIALIGFNILVSGVRTAIAAVFIGLFYYFIKLRSTKIAVTGFLLVCVGYIAISTNEDISNLFNSFVDVSGKQSDVSGSSISMRLNQLGGAFNEIKDTFLIGKGYDWNTYYSSKRGDHPILLGFESFIFIALCNGGIIGSIIWVIFFITLYWMPDRVLSKRSARIWAKMLLIIYVAYIIGTGDYKYMQFFAIYYTFFLSYLADSGKKEKLNTSATDG